MEPLKIVILTLTTLSMMAITTKSDNNNHIYSPCRDTTIQKQDGFTFGLAFSTKNSFYLNNNASIRLSPCDRRLSLSTSSNSQVAVFRPKVDEISLLTINVPSFNLDSNDGFMVAFAGSKYAARSTPVFVANDTHIVSSFTLLLEFEKGRLQNLFWKTDGCASCQGKSKFVCVNHEYCAMKLTDCKHKGGTVDCSLGIQLAFSGTDKHYTVFNSWYEVAKLRQYSLYGLYSNLRQSLADQYSKLF